MPGLVLASLVFPIVTLLLSSSAFVVIALSSVVGTPVIRVTATDGDEEDTPNSEITFSLSNSSLPFSINSTSGLITTEPDLLGQVYSVVVVASDNGPIALNSSGTITVDVARPNFQAPMFPGVFAFSIEENSSPTEPVFEFTVTDSDAGEEGAVRLVLIPSEFSGDFTLQSTLATNGDAMGRLFYNGSGFDREMMSNFTLTVQATDQGSVLFRRSRNATLEVSVDDVNDSPPVFVDAPYAATVSEITNTGVSIARARATDADEGTNAAITYSLDYTGSEFTIDTNTGDIQVSGDLVVATQSIIIRASDGVSTVSTYINITVTEENDNPPVFSLLPQAVVTLPENTEVGDVLFNVSVVDEDTGVSGAATLSIQQDGNTFRAGSYLGVNQFFIALNESLDFEVSNSTTIILFPRGSLVWFLQCSTVRDWDRKKSS